MENVEREIERLRDTLKDDVKERENHFLRLERLFEENNTLLKDLISAVKNSS
jgi:NurA-like 5'-3' nuclease